MRKMVKAPCEPSSKCSKPQLPTGIKQVESSTRLGSFLWVDPNTIGTTPVSKLGRVQEQQGAECLRQMMQHNSHQNKQHEIPSKSQTTAATAKHRPCHLTESSKVPVRTQDQQHSSLVDGRERECHYFEQLHLVMSSS